MERRESPMGSSSGMSTGGSGRSTPASPSTTGDSGVVDQAKQKASSLMDQAQQQVTPQVEAQKDRAAGQVSAVANAMRSTSSNLRNSEASFLAEYADRGAEQVEQFARYLRNADLGDLMGDAERIARQQPALFVGGAFLLGVFAARFLKSSAPEQSQFGNQGYGNPYGQGGNYRPGYPVPGYPGARSTPMSTGTYGTMGSQSVPAPRPFPPTSGPGSAPNLTGQRSTQPYGSGTQQPGRSPGMGANGATD